jgi:AraC-like DNA-binding protein
MAESAFTQGQTLAKVPIFSGLAENELSFLAQRALPRRYLAGELKQENGDENFVERIRIAIQQKLTGRRPNVEDIADALHISSRTLQRRLQDQGSRFQRVLEEARHQLARHYLNNSVLELNEAAYLLGYQDGNSFVRAFRNWEGVPPSRWREQQRAKAAS